MYYNSQSRRCPQCLMERIPEVRNVKEGKRKYVIFECRVCHHKDIERWEDRFRPPLWEGVKFNDSDDDSYFEDNENTEDSSG